MRKFLSAICLVLLAACSGGGGNEQISVDVYGDSIAFGVGVQVSPVQRLREAGFVVDDHSAVGLQLRSLIAGYAEPYPGAPQTYYPRGPQPAFAQVKRSAQFVVIQVGANDALGDADDFSANLRAAVDIVIAEGRTPILTGVVGIPVGDIFTSSAGARAQANNAATLELAREYGLLHAGWGEDYRGEEDLNSDSIHRTQEASDRLAARLVAIINGTNKQGGV